MGIHYFKIIDRKKWHQKKLPHSLKLSATNSAAHTPLSCSTTMVLRSPLKNSPPSLRPQETLLSHTGQCSSPRPSNPPRLEISSPPLPQLVQLPAQLPQEVLVQPPLLKRRKRRRRMRKRMLIWEDSSETMMTTEQSKIISHIKIT